MGRSSIVSANLTKQIQMITVLINPVIKKFMTKKNNTLGVIETNLISGNSLKNKHCNGSAMRLYLYGV